MQPARDFTPTPERPFCGTFIICGLLHAGDRRVSLILAQNNVHDEIVYKGLVPVGMDHPDFLIIRALPPHPGGPFRARGLEGAIWFDPDWTCAVSYTGLDASGLPEHPEFLGMCEEDGWLCREPGGDHQR